MYTHQLRIFRYRKSCIRGKFFSQFVGVIADVFFGRLFVLCVAVFVIWCFYDVSVELFGIIVHFLIHGWFDEVVGLDDTDIFADGNFHALVYRSAVTAVLFMYGFYAFVVLFVMVNDKTAGIAIAFVNQYDFNVF